MTRKHDGPHKPDEARGQDGARKRKSSPEIPSTGQGAASALDALIKRRLPAPQGNQPPAPEPDKH
jgi:hypothetical protein